MHNTMNTATVTVTFRGVSVTAREGRPGESWRITSPLAVQAALSLGVDGTVGYVAEGPHKHYRTLLGSEVVTYVAGYGGPYAGWRPGEEVGRDQPHKGWCRDLWDRNPPLDAEPAPRAGIALAAALRGARDDAAAAATFTGRDLHEIEQIAEAVHEAPMMIAMARLWCCVEGLHNEVPALLRLAMGSEDSIPTWREQAPGMRLWLARHHARAVAADWQTYHALVAEGAAPERIETARRRAAAVGTEECSRELPCGDTCEDAFEDAEHAHWCAGCRVRQHVTRPEAARPAEATPRPRTPAFKTEWYRDAKGAAKALGVEPVDVVAARLRCLADVADAFDVRNAGTADLSAWRRDRRAMQEWLCGGRPYYVHAAIDCWNNARYAEPPRDDVEHFLARAEALLPDGRMGCARDPEALHGSCSEHTSEMRLWCSWCLLQAVQ